MGGTYQRLDVDKAVRVKIDRHACRAGQIINCVSAASAIDHTADRSFCSKGKPVRAASAVQIFNTVEVNGRCSGQGAAVYAGDRPLSILIKANQFVVDAVLSVDRKRLEASGRRNLIDLNRAAFLLSIQRQFLDAIQ